MNFIIEDRGNGIKWVRLSSSNPGMYEMSKWCREHECGKQVSIHAISFKNDEEMTMFLLRWQGKE